MVKRECRRHFERLLCDYFDKDKNLAIMDDRSWQELPYHLASLGETKRLEKCLTKANIVDNFANWQLSADLIQLWQTVSIDHYESDSDTVMLLSSVNNV